LSDDPDELDPAILDPDVPSASDLKAGRGGGALYGA